MADIQRNQWAVVINAPIGTDIKVVYDNLETYCILEADNFYRIIHDKDILENGELKRPHIHLVVELKTRVRFTTMLSRLSYHCKVAVNCISLQDIKNTSKIVQYLTHKNDISKYQYSDEEVDTNNRERYNYLVMADEKVALTTDELFDIIDNAKDVRELVRKLGIDLYMKYARVIDLLWKDKNEHLKQSYYYSEV